MLIEELREGTLPVPKESGFCIQALMQDDGNPLYCGRLSLAAVSSGFSALGERLESAAQKLRGGAKPPEPPEPSPLGDLRGMLKWPPGPPDKKGDEDADTPRGSEAGDKTEGSDARTLWVSWDEHGKRYKPWREVVQ